MNIYTEKRWFNCFPPVPKRCFKNYGLISCLLLHSRLPRNLAVRKKRFTSVCVLRTWGQPTCWRWPRVLHEVAGGGKARLPPTEGSPKARNQEGSLTRMLAGNFSSHWLLTIMWAFLRDCLVSHQTASPRASDLDGKTKKLQCCAWPTLSSHPMSFLPHSTH